MARRPGTWDIHVSHHSATGGAAWLGGDALGRTRGESWIRQHPGFRQPALGKGATRRPRAAARLGTNSSAAFPDPGQPFIGINGPRRPGQTGRRVEKKETGVRLQLGGCPTSTTDLLGDLGQLASPAWVSVSSSVN